MNAAYVHLLLNHIPILGTAFGVLFLVYALVRNRTELKRIAQGIFVLAALAAVPVYLTGEPAEEVVEHQPGVFEDAIEQHEGAALYALIGVEALGLLSLVGLFASRGDRDLPGGLMGVTLLLAVGVVGLMVWTAYLGGKISHPELVGNAVLEVETEED